MATVALEVIVTLKVTVTLEVMVGGGHCDLELLRIWRSM